MDINEEQGCLTECVYCTEIRPDLDSECPFCKGEVNYFRPAQMMSEQNSRQQILHDIFRFPDIYNEIEKSKIKKKQPKVSEMH